MAAMCMVWDSLNRGMLDDAPRVGPWAASGRGSAVSLTLAAG